MDDASRKPVPFAHAADIVRAHQKDEYCRGLLRQHFCESLEEVIGHRRAVPWQGVVAMLADCVYALATAVLSGRTLGEEYCEIVAVTTAPRAAATAASAVARVGVLTAASGLRRPSRQRRLLAAALLLLAGPAIKRLLPAGTTAGRRPQGLLRRRLQSIGATVPVALRLHLAGFYIFSAYRHVSDRCARLRYVSVADRPYRDFSYWYLGILLAAQAAGELCSWYVQWRRQKTEAAADKAATAAVYAASGRGARSIPATPASSERAPLCNVCFCPAECATCTPCGHIYCWECIASWCAIKATCPLCRSVALPQQLLPLRHYELPPPG